LVHSIGRCNINANLTTPAAVEMKILLKVRQVSDTYGWPAAVAVAVAVAAVVPASEE